MKKFADKKFCTQFFRDEYTNTRNKKYAEFVWASMDSEHLRTIEYFLETIEYFWMRKSLDNVPCDEPNYRHRKAPCFLNFFRYRLNVYLFHFPKK